VDASRFGPDLNLNFTTLTLRRGFGSDLNHMELDNSDAGTGLGVVELPMCQLLGLWGGL
jgi:hypothetical protein